MNIKRWVALVALLLALAVRALAEPPIGVKELGTVAPPNILEDGSFSFSMDYVFSVPGAAATGDLIDSFSFSGRTVTLSPSLTLLGVGNGWATWGHGYSGVVLHRTVPDFAVELEDPLFDPFALTYPVTLMLPQETKAFVLYLEPNFFGLSSFQISASNGIDTLDLLPQEIQGQSGAAGFGFYSTDVNLPLTSITISGVGTWPDGYGIGEFGIDRVGSGVPDGGNTVILLGFGALALVSLRRALSR